MKVVVEIPEEQYELILKSHINANSVFVSKECMMYAIKNGKPLDSVLGEIRAEINKLPDLNPDYEMDKTIHVSKWAVFDIIDKYKESEDKNR